jgi:hypothetical protein
MWDLSSVFCQRHGSSTHTSRVVAKPMPNSIFVGLTISIVGTLVLPPSVSPHDGKLDSYGCHYTQEHKDYHCHEGAFKGASFESKIEMIRQLKLQFLNLGRPWPYDDVAEEDITYTEKQTR